MKYLLLTFLSLCHSIIISQVIYPGSVTLGTPEMVFDYSVDKCNTIDIPDAPARVFRDASGTINLIASHYTTWRMTGTSFSSLTKDCSPVMTSHLDTDPSKFNNNEWIVATYTEDGTNIHALVHDEYVPCGNWNNCWYNGITYVSSTDGGQNYTHSTAPSHLVAASPYQSPYPSTHTPFGIFGGSNIIKKDGYYYVMVHLEDHLLQQWGVGLLRTNDLSDPTSWRGWDGTGFNVQFVNPYTASGYNTADKILEPISKNEIGKMCASITYNTYFGKYMVVDFTSGIVDGVTKYGFFYSLSDDLIHWSNKRLILQTASTWAAGGSYYPSIIDHNDVTRNFEQAGQSCYLYYTKWNSGTYDRDLIRIPITFSQTTVNGFVVNTTGDGDDATPGDGLCKTTGNVCSLRAAIQEGNARPPYDNYDVTAIPVTYNIPGSGVQTIQPSTYLTEIFYPLAINGYTQSGASENTNAFELGMNTAITIKLDAINGGAHALAYHCGNNTLRGMSIVNGNVDILYEPGYSKSRNNNHIEGCFLGMDTDGLTAVPSLLNIYNQDSIFIGGITNASRNLIGGGVYFKKSSSDFIYGNYFGSTADGMSSSGAIANSIQLDDSCSFVTIGGAATGEKNLISGGIQGVIVNGTETFSNSIVSNYIGLAADGISGLGNQSIGIALTGATYSNNISGNTIVANSIDEAGIWLDNTWSNSIVSNYIGTDVSETAVLGNGDVGTFSGGILLMGGSHDNTIGGINPSEGNVIANNNFGIILQPDAGNGNILLSNSIYNSSELAIDIEGDYSPLPNDNLDADTGPNDLQNYPVISSAYVTATQISINGILNSKASRNFTIQFFDNGSCNASGNGEGKTLIGSDTVTTNASGNATISSHFTTSIPAGHQITALATDQITSSTSEFSLCHSTQSSSPPPVPSISANGPLSFCAGGSVILTASASSAYLWSTGQTTQSITVSSSGQYSVTVYNAQGLGSTSSSTTVTVNIPPTITISGVTSVCSGSSTTLTATGANTYSWSGGPATASYSVTPATSTTYVVTGTSNGCTASISQFVTVNPLPNISAGIDQNICEGDSVILSGSGGATYTWNNSVENNVSFSPTITATYTVIGTTLGCTATDQVVVTVHPLPLVVANDASVCGMETVVLNATGAISYLWSPSTYLSASTGALVTFTPGSTTTYTVTGTSAFGCTSVDSLVVTVFSLPNIPLISESSSVLTSSPELTYQWYLNGTAISGASAQSYTPLVSGVYSVAVTDSNGCAAMSIDFQFTISGLTKTQLNDVIEIAPNPGNGLFYIKMQTDEFISLRVTDSKGALILISDTFSNTIDLSDQTPGLYHCRIITSKGTLVKKLVLTDGME